MMRSILLAGIALLSLSACDDGKITELSRHPSPVGEMDAVVGRMKAGESEPFMVVLSRTGEAADKGTRLLVADHVVNPRVEWADADHMTIRCDAARIWSYRNFWTSPDSKATIAITLACGETGWQPAGQ